MTQNRCTNNSMTVDEAKDLILEMDDGEWAFSFDSLGMHSYGDTLSNIHSGRDTPCWKVFMLLDYMMRCEAERP